MTRLIRVPESRILRLHHPRWITAQFINQTIRKGQNHTRCQALSALTFSAHPRFNFVFCQPPGKNTCACASPPFRSILIKMHPLPSWYKSHEPLFYKRGVLDVIQLDCKNATLDIKRRRIDYKNTTLGIKHRQFDCKNTAFDIKHSNLIVKLNNDTWIKHKRLGILSRLA